MTRLTLRRDPEIIAFEMNGRCGVSPTPDLMVAVYPPSGRGHADGSTVDTMVQLRVRLERTRMWFLNRLRLDDTGREARVLRYDAIRDSWKVVARHKW